MIGLLVRFEGVLGGAVSDSVEFVLLTSIMSAPCVFVNALGERESDLSSSEDSSESIIGLLAVSRVTWAIAYPIHWHS